MELKKGSQTSKPPRAEAFYNVKKNAASKRCTGSKSITELVLGGPDLTENSNNSSDGSTITSDSASKEFIEVYPRISSLEHGLLPHKSNSAKEKENDISDEDLNKMEEYFGSSSSSSSRVSDVTHESSIPTVLPTHRPPILVMDRTGDFDPDRIPASIFGKPISAMDWSLASNESLFSIQIGQGSFSIDLVNSAQLSINDGSFKGSGELEIRKEPVSKEKAKNALHFGLGTRISDEPIAYRHNRSNSDGVKIKIEGFGNEITIQNTPSKQESLNSSCVCSSCGCPSCHCFSTPACCIYQWPSCSCKCLSCCPKFACGSWPSCSCKGCSWSDCLCKCFSCPKCSCGSWPSCSCKRCSWLNCSCKCLSCPTCTWCCSWPNWSCKKLCCLGFVD